MDIGDKILLAACAFPLVCLLCAWIRHKTHPYEGFVVYDQDPDSPPAQLPEIDMNQKKYRAEEKRRRDERQARRDHGRGRDWWF